LAEFKKTSCINIDLYIPIVKVDEDDEALSDAKLDQIKMNKRKRRRYMNSFYNADNLVEEEEQPLGPLLYYEMKDKECLKFVYNNLIKPEPVVIQQQ
jgi:hypothetical protein